MYGERYMGRAILAFIVTIIVGFVSASYGVAYMGNFAEWGSIVAIATMGAFIIFYNEKNKGNKGDKDVTN